MCHVKIQVKTHPVMCLSLKFCMTIEHRPLNIPYSSFSFSPTSTQKTEYSYWLVLHQFDPLFILHGSNFKL